MAVRAGDEGLFTACRTARAQPALFICDACGSRNDVAVAADLCRVKPVRARFPFLECHERHDTRGRVTQQDLGGGRSASGVEGVFLAAWARHAGCTIVSRCRLPLVSIPSRSVSFDNQRPSLDTCRDLSAPQSARFNPRRASFDPQCVYIDDRRASFDPQCAYFDDRCAPFDPQCGYFDARCASFVHLRASSDHRCASMVRRRASFDRQLGSFPTSRTHTFSQ